MESAVEWLVANLDIDLVDSDWYIEKAKEMEKQQKGYSEEEASELVYNIIGEYAKHYGIMIDGSKLNDLFEQFKKKNYERIRI